jgi:hypothetical protein
MLLTKKMYLAAPHVNKGHRRRTHRDCPLNPQRAITSSMSNGFLKLFKVLRITVLCSNLLDRSMLYILKVSLD